MNLPIPIQICLVHAILLWHACQVSTEQGVFSSGTLLFSLDVVTCRSVDQRMQNWGIDLRLGHYPSSQPWLSTCHLTRGHLQGDNTPLTAISPQGWKHGSSGVRRPSSHAFRTALFTAAVRRIDEQTSDHVGHHRVACWKSSQQQFLIRQTS